MSVEDSQILIWVSCEHLSIQYESNRRRFPTALRFISAVGAKYSMPATGCRGCYP